MSDIFREVDEELRRDRLAKFGKRYGPLIIAVALVIVLGTGAYVGWQRWQASRAETQTAQLTEALALAQADPARNGGPQAAADALAALAAQSGAGRGTLARFYEAGLRADQGNTAAAVQIYDELARSADVMPAYRDLATILSVLHQIGTGDPGELQARLAPLTAEGSPWRHTARELNALLAARTGDRATARTLFAQLAEDPAAPAGVRARAADLAAYYAD